MHLRHHIIVALLLVAATGISFGQLRSSSLEAGKNAFPPTPQIFSATQDASSSSSKSVVLAAMYSLILPGMGELYAGSFESGKYYLLADGGLWLTYAGFQLHGTWLRKDARSFARQHAGADASHKDEQFEVNIGNFRSVADYNEVKLRNRQYDLLYDPNSNFRWSWDNDANRTKYRDLRIRSDEVLQNSKFVIGALVINRLISAFNAGRAAALHNQESRVDASWRINASVDGGLLSAQGIMVNFSKEF